MPNFSDSNRGRYKRVVGFERHKPIQLLVVENSITRSFDVNSMAIQRDFYKVPGPLGLVINSSGGGSSGSYPTGVYEENIITLLNESSKIVNFSTFFINAPIVTLEILPNGGAENINAFIAISNTNGFFLELSTQYSGQIKYRAIYGASYPVIVERTPLLPGQYYTASAGTAGITANNYYTGSFDSLGSIPSEVFTANYDSAMDGSANVGYSFGPSYDLTSVSGDISSEVSTTINFMAVK